MNTKQKQRVTLWLSPWLSEALYRRKRDDETVAKTVERVFRELERYSPTDPCPICGGDRDKFPLIDQCQGRHTCFGRE